MEEGPIAARAGHSHRHTTDSEPPQFPPVQCHRQPVDQRTPTVPTSSAGSGAKIIAVP